MILDSFDTILDGEGDSLLEILDYVIELHGYWICNMDITINKPNYL